MRGGSMFNNIQAIFIDRDGTIGGSDTVTYPEEFELYPNVFELIQLLKRSGKLILAFTNQPGISKGEVSQAEFENELLQFGFNKVYICPHQHNEGCNCRKPATGMLLKAAKENDLKLKNCIVIGDRWTDMVAASEVGCIKILVKTGAGNKEYTKYINKEFYGGWGKVIPDYIAEDLKDAIFWLMKED